MFRDTRRRMLANMSERADTPPLNWSDWSDFGVSELPTGTVTLLLASDCSSRRAPCKRT
jgi:hypothetical protein